MKFNLDESAQSSAELILLIGALIVIILVAITCYKNYIVGINGEINAQELDNLNKSINNLSNKFI